LTYRVYISHSVDDAPLAREIAEGVKKAGAQPIMVEESTRPEQNWLEEIRRNLNKSDEMVVILSRKSVRNEWVNIEMGAAFGLHKLTTPITSDLDSRELPSVVRALQAVRYNRADAYFRELGKRVERRSSHIDLNVPELRSTDSTYEVRVANEFNFRRLTFDRHPKVQGPFRPDFAIPSSKKPRFFVEARGNLTKESSVGWLNYNIRTIRSAYPQIKMVIISKKLTANTRRLLSKHWNYVFADSEMDDLVELLISSQE
jgi:hypothetical protein